MAKDRSTIGQIANFVRLVASAVIGIPTALAASVVMGSLFLAVEFANIMYSHAIKNSIGLKVLKFTPALAAASDFFKNAVVKCWSEWGVYPYITAATYVAEALDSFCKFEEETYRDRVAQSKFEKLEKERHEREQKRLEAEASGKKPPEPTPDEIDHKIYEEQEKEMMDQITKAQKSIMEIYEKSVVEIDADQTLEDLMAVQKEGELQDRQKTADQTIKKTADSLDDILGKEELDADTKEILKGLQSELRNPKNEPREPRARPMHPHLRNPNNRTPVRTQ